MMNGGELERIEQEIETAGTTEDSLDQESSGLHMQITEAEVGIEDLVVKLNSKLDMINELKGTIDALVSGGGEVAQLQKMFDKAKSDHTALQEELAQKQRRKKELLTEYAVALDTKKEIQVDFETTTERLQEILAEHDWIARMLNGKGKATEKQREVINRNDDILRIRGGAGTGKSLVLLTKCLRELDKRAFEFSQEAINFDEADLTREALLITYNKTLRNYLQGILDRLSESDDISDTVKRIISNINIYSYDSYVLSQLHRHS
jgi:DNA repair exonuclease SbcCD ATPase subunit